MEHIELLQNYREQIDTLDKEMIYLLSRRFEIVKQI
jgi:chorismate mutase